MSTTAVISPRPSLTRLDATSPHVVATAQRMGAASPRRAATAPRLASRELAAEAWEREQLIDRLRSLRRVLPVLAQEMAAARRQAARLKTDNRRLSEQVRELRSALEASERRGR